MIWVIVLVLVVSAAAIIYGYSLPDPSSWTMPKAAQNEYDRKSGL